MPPMRCRCHVTAQNTKDVPILIFQIAARLVLSVHFAAEFVDKVTNWDYWVDQISAAGFPIPTFMLLLVVILLGLGTPLLAAGIFMRWAAGLLLLFQIPTTIFFENDSWYEQADSISVMGGVLLAVIVDELQRQDRKKCCSRTNSDASGVNDAALVDPIANESASTYNHMPASKSEASVNSLTRDRLLSDRDGEIIV